MALVWCYRLSHVDLFEGIAAQDLTAWLQDHPQVEVLARDRA